MERRLFGVDAASGAPLLLDTADAVLAQWATGEASRDLRRIDSVLESLGPDRGAEPDWSDYTKVGWGIIFGETLDPKIHAAGMRLHEHRSAQFQDPNARKKRCKVLSYSGETTARDWIVNQGGDAGNFNPTTVPYYLLVVGGPEAISFDFTRDLNVEYCVGRLAFDTPADYDAYVDSVIAWEKSACVLPRRAGFFAPCHDPATKLSTQNLISPLLNGWPDDPTDSSPTCEANGFRPTALSGEAATRSALQDLLSDRARQPAFLLTASHGAEYPAGSDAQRSGQGNLIDDAWPGNGPTVPHQFGPDLVPTSGLNGMMTFAFACHSAGTPRFDAIFRNRENQELAELTPTPFIASLPQAMLRNGALGFIGHVDLALGKSLMNPNGDPQPGPFLNLTRTILGGEPIGLGLRDFNKRYASLSSTLGTLIQRRRERFKVPDIDIVNVWLARNDAGGYVLLGDPACRLTVEPQ